MDFVELNPDQRRETVNTFQRFQALQKATARHRACRGSMVWSTSRGRDYLMRAGYDKNGRRKQVSLGLRSERTASVKAEFERARDEAEKSLDAVRSVMDRQASVNRALGLGRVPLLSARIVRAIEGSGLLGAGIRVLGTHAIYAYEAASGVHIDPGLTTTGDIDLLLDARRHLAFVTTEDWDEASLIRLLQRVDKSFARTEQPFRAANDEGYLVDLIRPLRNPPWTKEPTRIGGDPGDLSAIEIAGLSWLESAPLFEAVAIDERGEPLRIATSDPRVFAAHKHWLSKRADREPVKRLRDLKQAQCVAALIGAYMPHLAFDAEQLRMLPKDVADEAKRLFEANALRS
jgi:hypothetical protein